MKRALVILIVLSVLSLFCTLGCQCEEAGGEQAVETAGAVNTAEPEGGVVIPAGIVLGIMAGAVILGGSFGYYYARKQR